MFQVHFCNADKWSVLALLRFFLALIVAVNHLAEYAPLGPLTWIPRLGAFEAILGFLLVSGYSIGSSYKKSPDGFYLRRAWRIYPVYAAAIALTSVAAPVEVTPSFVGVLLLNAVFLNQVFTATSYVGPAWSLSLEVWLYLLTPMLAKSSSSRLAKLALASFLVYAIHTCGRTLFHWPYPAFQGGGLNLVILSFPWLLGFVLAQGAGSHRQVLRWIGLALMGHWLLAVAIQWGHRMKHDTVEIFWTIDTPDFVMRLLTLLLVWLCLKYAVEPRSRSSAKPTRSLWMTRLGDCSYPLYLTHVPVGILCNRFAVNDMFTVLGAMLGTSAAAYLMFDSYSRSREARLVLTA